MRNNLTQENVKSLISRRQANSVNDILRSNIAPESLEFRQAINIVYRWRKQHVPPTQDCFRQLIAYTWSYQGAVVTYRLKRLRSIIDKLKRAKSKYELGGLDDIGGCRVIVENIDQLKILVPALCEKMTLKSSGGIKDYIEKPRESGYRSCHLLVKQQVEGQKQQYRVELQIRTKLQHYWATALEAISEIYGKDYKNPNSISRATSDDKEVLEFFKIVSCLFAIEEHSPVISGMDRSQDRLVKRLRNVSCCSRVLNDLKQAQDAALVIQKSHKADAADDIYLLKLSRQNQLGEVEPFGDLTEALSQYESLESGIQNPPGDRAAIYQNAQNEEAQWDNVVLVSTEELNPLALAYPNYDTNGGEFVRRVEKYLD